MEEDRDIDKNFKDVIMPRMAFSADRDDPDQGEGDIDLDGILDDLRWGRRTYEERCEEEEEEGHRMNLLGDYVKGLTKKPPQHVNQEFRTALTAEAVRNLEKIRSVWGEKVWEEVTHQLLRSWEDVRVYCYDHHCSCPDLPSLFQDGCSIPTELEERSLLYTQTYLRSVGWRGAGEERQTPEAWEASRDVRELLARSLVTFVESMIVLPPNLRDFLAHWVQKEGRLPQREDLLMQVRQQGVSDAAHVAWLEDRYTEAKNLLILSNMRFVVYKAGQYRGKGVDVADLIQESALGIMDAANRFEPHRGGIFVNFAADHILKAIRAEFAEGQDLICRPHTVGAEIKELESGEYALWGTLGRRPSSEELRKALSWSVETFERVQQARRQGIISLETSIVGDKEGKTIGETLADPESIGTVLEQGYHILLHDLLTETLKGMPEKEREIIMLRHGLNGGPPYTLQQAADILKLTRERVRQIESCGEARLIRIIARRFPHLLPDGLTPELAMILADQKDWAKKKKEVRTGIVRRRSQEEEVPFSEDGVLVVERAMRWALLTHTGIASTYHAVLHEQAVEVVQRGGTFVDVQRALQEKMDALAIRGGKDVS